MDTLLKKLSMYHLKKAYYQEMEQVLGNIEILKRLERAYIILTQSREYDITLEKARPLTFKVHGPHDTYTVIENERLCTCPDGQTLCKHRFCIKLILASIKLQKLEHFKIKEM